MKYLCLIYLDEERMAALPPGEMNALNVGHLALNDRLRQSGHFIEAEALMDSSRAVTVRFPKGLVSLTDGPFTESKELVAGFYLIEAADMAEAVEVAARFPGGRLGHVEIWPTRQLVVDDTLA